MSAAYDVIVSPFGGVYLTGCNRLVQVGYENASTTAAMSD